MLATAQSTQTMDINMNMIWFNIAKIGMKMAQTNTLLKIVVAVGEKHSTRIQK